MGAADAVPDPPGHLQDLLQRLRRHGFTEIESRHDANSFGNAVRVFQRDPITIRIVRDRGDWSAEMTADGWPRHEHAGVEWVFPPPHISEDDD